MSPEELKLSDWSSRQILHDRINSTPEEVKAIALRNGCSYPARPTYARATSEVDIVSVGVARPKTLEEKRAAAKEVVRVVRDLHYSPSKALASCGFMRSYTLGVSECIAGKGPITMAARSEDLSKLNQSQKINASFVRWFYDLDCINATVDEKSHKLKDRIKELVANGWTRRAIGKAAGVGHSSVENIIRCPTYGVGKAIRERLWDFLNSLPKSA